MFTECPECQTAFRVTAQLLRQARGQVQCGDCGHTFDALDQLSEESPATDLGNRATSNDFEKSSRDLLRSLDVLTGNDDVRIEDTGVEWRVLDMDGVNDDDSDAAPRQETSAAGFDETDQSSASGNVIQEADDTHGTGLGEQLRFDDDSPVPDDYESTALHADGQDAEPSKDDASSASDAKETLRVSIDTGTDGDWQDLLAEVDGATADSASLNTATDEDTFSDTLDGTGEAVFADEFDDLTTDGVEVPAYELLAAVTESGDDAASGPADEEKKRPSQKSSVEQEDEDADDTLVQSIIMEGDSVTDMIEIAERASYDDVPPPDDSDDDSQQLSSLQRLRSHSIGSTLGLSIAMVLGLLLVGQYVHANRESLATSDLFRQVAEPFYEFAGKPLNPSWEIRSWQFAATRGSTDDTDANLTIYSQISNQGASPLPYPLIHLSLTDRWDEVIASRVLRPGQYLAGDRNVAKNVDAGDSFAAVITVAAPAPAATGFKLNVCYPMSGQRLRCAIEDFRD
ncbi:MAG: DUF3426 domain-containing protein [Woeseia sp.]|nr:zinc-ribbon domain-containing protein [Woeseia sp.]NNE61682.1 DUF3426 domain-containing protein [Woeseia sp.]NNL55235.1 DUF3426 domain-containing protein [Woeseia sp.]